MTRSTLLTRLRVAVLSLFLVLAPFASVSFGQTGGSTGANPVRTDIDDDDDGFPWGLLGLAGLLGLLGLKPRRDHVVHNRTHDTAR